MSEFNIEKGVPLPEKSATLLTKLRTAMEAMEIGDSIAIPDLRQMGQAQYIGRKLAPKKFVTRRTDEKYTSRRVWRIA